MEEGKEGRVRKVDEFYERMRKRNEAEREEINKRESGGKGGNKRRN